MRRATLILLLILLGCGPEPAVDRGRALLSDPRLSPSAANVFACSTCHAASAEGDGRRLPGHTLQGAARRPRFWGGKVDYLLDAVNLCVSEFMRGERLRDDDAQGLALLAYLQSIASGPDAERPLAVVSSIDEAYLGALPPGDGARGAAGYEAACRSCHGEPHSGSGRLGPRISILPEDTLSVFPAQARAVMAEKARHGKFFGISGVMPFFARELLSDGELADILLYLLP